MPRINDMNGAQAQKALRIINVNYELGETEQQRAFFESLKAFAQHDDAEVRGLATKIAVAKGLEEPPQSHHLADPLRPAHNLD